MTRLEENALRALIACSFPSRTWHARFVRELWNRYLRDPRLLLTNGEERALWILTWRYRGQLRGQVNMAAVLAEAERRHFASCGTPVFDFSGGAVEAKKEAGGSYMESPASPADSS